MTSHNGREFVRPAFTAPARQTAVALPDENRWIISGELHATNRDVAIHTTLGSCVSACVYDVSAGVGGMNHFMLPGRPGASSLRYGRTAMAKLVARLMQLGGKYDRLRCKLIGGAHLSSLDLRNIDVGSRNAEFAREWLTKAGIPLEGERMGGTEALRVCFLPQQGKVRFEGINMAILHRLRCNSSQRQRGSSGSLNGMTPTKRRSWNPAPCA